MTTLDWIIVAFTAAMAVWGYQQGLLVGALSLAGFAGGGLIGTRVAPKLLAEGAHSPYAPLMALVGALLIGGVVAIMLEAFAHDLRHRLVRGSILALLDGVAGAALIASVGLGLAWIFGAVALNTPGATELRRDIQRSAILKGLNELLPPTGPLLNALNRIDPFPRVEGPEAGVPPPNAAIAADPDVDAARRSVVRILGTACGLGVEGSGWVVAAKTVVTNAHVVAGQDDTTVAPNGGGQHLDAEVVSYDPHNDLAILRVPLLNLPALRVVPQPRKGTSGAILGFPLNGPYRVEPARLGGTELVLADDSYGRGPIRRNMTSIRGKIVSGNSGGPVVDGRGRVLATVFSATTSGPPGGFGVPNEAVSEAVGGALAPVGTGPCVTH